MMWHRLALALGKSVRECQESVNPEEFKMWLAYYRLQPWDATRQDFMTAQLIALTANIHKKQGSRVFKPVDFMPWEKSANSRKMSQRQIQKTFEIFAKMHNARLKGKQ